jgi:hypothetical protein
MSPYDMDDLDDRRSYVGTTLVYSNRYGPSEFWQNGRQVGCVCDPDAGLTCAYHGRMQEDRPARAPEETTRREPARRGRSR